MENNPQARLGGMDATSAQRAQTAAADHLRTEGLIIVETNPLPLGCPQRTGIDIVAYDPRNDTMVFAQVRAEAHSGARSREIPDKRGIRALEAACRFWQDANKWHGDCRFDVIDVFGKSPNPGVRRVQCFFPALGTP